MTLKLLILKEAPTTFHARILILNTASKGKMTSALVEVSESGCYCRRDSPGRMGQTCAGGGESKVLLEVLSFYVDHGIVI